jgi:Family of unknown function (DUF6869)
MKPSVESLADDWIAFERYPNPNHAPEHVSDRAWALYDLCREQPELAWAVIRSIVGRYSEADLFTERETEARRIVARLAAGPLENLLAEHGPSLIGKVEAEAGRDRRFFWALGCVWKNAMTEDVWARVRRAAGGMSR